MKTVRFGIAGLGAMGSAHARSLLSGSIPRAELAAVCDAQLDLQAYAPGAALFRESEQMIRSGQIDAILIATPHFSHTPIGIDALQQGLHVLVEKPISVTKVAAQQLIAAHTNPAQVFGAVFNQRTDPLYRKLRELIQTGQLGTVRRINWIVTDWFRTAAYYRAGGWRASWAGEGGGVLVNQCQHNLDLFHWLFGMPSKVHAHCQYGRYHDIEVEDDVTAYFEFPNGTTAVFISSTGEAPGTNRLEVTAENGRVIVENGSLQWVRNETPTSVICQTSPDKYAPPKSSQVPVLTPGENEQHAGILKNFTAAILDRVPLIAPAAEGLAAVELTNAILLSAFQDRAVALPLDDQAFEESFQPKIANSRYQPTS